MKKSIFEIGTVLNKTEQKSIHGGNGSNLRWMGMIDPGGSPSRGNGENDCHGEIECS